MVCFSTFALEDEAVVYSEIYRIKTQGVACSGHRTFQVCPRPVHDRHEVIAYDFHTRLRDRGQSGLPRTDEMPIRSGSKLDRIVNRNTFHHRPDEAGRENLISSREHLVRWPCFASLEMMQRGDDPDGPRLLDVVERQLISRR